MRTFILIINKLFVYGLRRITDLWDMADFPGVQKKKKKLFLMNKKKNDEFNLI